MEVDNKLHPDEFGEAIAQSLKEEPEKRFDDTAGSEDDCEDREQLERGCHFDIGVFGRRNVDADSLACDNLYCVRLAFDPRCATYDRTHDLQHS